MQLWVRAMCACLFAAVLASAGCGGGGDSNVGKVSGTVTLDGQPLPNALVTFTPKVGGSPSYGRTDESGEYELSYTRDQQGAVIGEHTVTITTYDAGDPDEEPPLPAVPEKVPTKYNLQTTLTEKVDAGSNTIDFELDSQGRIVQPRPESE